MTKESVVGFAILAALSSSCCDAASVPLLTVRVQAIQVSDDDGGRAANVTPDQVAQWVEFANRAFADARIRFEFHLDGSDWSVLKSTLLNNMTGTSDPAWVQEKAFGNEIAARHPGKLVLFCRHGPGPNPTGGGFSWWDYNFVAMPGFADASHCGHPHIDAFAHEAGHYLGLPHTFSGDPFKTIDEAETFFQDRGDDPAAFDGDGFTDTPPDPAVRTLECQRVAQITLDGVLFVLPRDNLMSYYDERRALSPQQIARARWILEKRIAGQGALPGNLGATRPVEVEGLRVAEHSAGYTEVQPMAGFGRGSWSGEAQVFWAAKPGDSLTFLLPVEAEGRYRIGLYATLAPDYGRVQVWLDDSRIGQPLDAYAPVVLPSGRVSLGTQWLSAGMHSLGFEMVSKNPASTGYKFGIDCADLVLAVGVERR